MRPATTAFAASLAVLTACMRPGQASDPSTLHALAGGTYVQRNLVSDGSAPAERVDPNLVNGWGIAHGPATPWWVSDNGTGVATLYDGDGVPRPLVVSVAGSGGQPAAPTGVVFNDTGAFSISAGGTSAPARFLFASEDGTLSGWNPGVPPPATSTQSVVAVDNSASGAVYKALAVASTEAGPRLYAANFHAGTVEIYDGSFAPAPAPGAFLDPEIPAGFAPFGLRVAGGRVYVTFAKQDDARHDEVDGPGLGYVSAFDLDGTFVRRVASQGKLNAPWGLALAPSGFGRLSGRLLVGNFGDGHIVGYALDDDGQMGDDGDGDADEDGGAYLTGTSGRITIDGLWGIGFGNDAAAGPSVALFFAAGPSGEQHGLFGRIDFVLAGPAM